MITGKAKIDIEFTVPETIISGDKVNAYLDSESEPVASMNLSPDMSGETITLRTTPIDDGDHTITIKIMDSNGNESDGVSQEIIIIGSPEPPTDIAAIEGETEAVKLTWTKSVDDE